MMVGNGPSGATMSLMRAIELHSGSSLVAYTYTDVLPELVDQARMRFKEWIAPIDFKLLDISQDPLRQGLSTHGYDLILASMVSFTPTGRGTAMEHIKKLMRSNGRLVLLEPTYPEASENEHIDGSLTSVS